MAIWKVLNAFESVFMKTEHDEGKYGDVEYADKKNNKYPIDTEKHVRAAWSYIHQKRNAAKYNEDELERIKGHIKEAAKRFGIDINDQSSAIEEFVDITEIFHKIRLNHDRIDELREKRVSIVAHDVSREFMKSIDPANMLVEAGLCPAYESLEDIPRLYYDETIEKIDDATKLHGINITYAHEGIVDTIKRLLVKHKVIREKYEHSLKNAVEVFETIHSFDEHKFNETSISSGPMKRHADDIIKAAEKVYGILGNDFLIKAVEEMIGYLKHDNAEPRINAVLKRIGGHLRPLVIGDEFVELTHHKIILNSKGEFVDVEHVGGVGGWAKELNNKVSDFGFRISDLKHYADKMAHINKLLGTVESQFDETMFTDLYDHEYYSAKTPSPLIRRVEKVAEFVYMTYYNRGDYPLIGHVERTIHNLLVAAIKARNDGKDGSTEEFIDRLE